MKRVLLLAVAASLAAVVILPSAASAAKPPKTASITFLSASCPSSSAIYQARMAGRDPNSADNGTSTAEPADIAAYGCSETRDAKIYLLGGSTPDSVFLDDALTTAAVASGSDSAADGSATVFASGQTVYVPAGMSATRRFASAGHTATVSTAAPLPFIDLQCYNDGANNDNGDGIGWSGQSLAAGVQAYCILYTWDGQTPPVVPPTPTPLPETTPVKLQVHKQTWVPDKKDPTDGKWKPATPPGQYRFALSDANGALVATLVDNELLEVKPGDYLVSEVDAAGRPDGRLFDLFVSEKGSSGCKEPEGGNLVAKVSTSEAAKDGVIHLCAYNRDGVSGPAAAISKTFVTEKDGVVTWRIEPSVAADLQVWDARAVTCQEFGGAACGGIGAGDYGKFYADETGQYLLVTQPVEKEGDECAVTNTVEWSAEGSRERESTSATYKCSGASTMGWPLFGVLTAGMAGIGVYLHRKHRWGA